MESKLNLISKAKKGDINAFQTLIHMDKEKLYKIAYVYLRNEDDALEVFQETIYKAFESLSKLKNDEYFSTWMTRILINSAINLLRKKKQVVPINKEVLENISDTSSFNSDVQIDLLKAMEEIEEKYKTVLLLRYYQDYTVKQIASMLKCPEGTVKTNIRRGLDKLKEKMKGVYSDDKQNSIV
ncbi:sigma-70 family RNA polymerase sigma factor [Neobacillus vireti]|uniref:RNA polymerase sigma factor sigV n=1 Tax=Neobacillus vireti LMG 21834 TaxID=1131730 RepID=A0AB94IK02_9BACI|nr:sigma-70 family RNA polymerase sigma factor [Neobacillus vireti]ETI67317.1 RNA polymerase sigma factor sigV [Neobacillus vireti LMG 21834]KLT18290.1 RNA polymerase sigma70 factor [Neobacillus vireti]